MAETNDPDRRETAGSHISGRAPLPVDILERITDGFFALDPEWRCVYVNRKGAELAGRKPEELIGKHLWTEFPDTIGQPFHRACHKAAAEQVPAVLEHYYPAWDKWFESRIYPSPDGLTIYYRDVTAERRTETQLRRQDEQLRLAVKAANVGLWDWSLATNEVRFSPEWKSQIGYGEDEISDDFSEWEGRVHPDDRSRVLGAIDEYRRDPRSLYEQVFRLRHKDGSYRWILTHATLTLDDRGAPVRMMGSHIDITRQKLAEQALIESEERFRATFEQAAVGIAHFSLDWRLLRANSRLSQMLGYSRGGAIMDPRAGVVLPPTPEPYLEQFARMCAGEMERHAGEREIRRKDGSTFWANVTVSLVRSPSGAPEYAIAVVEDITERKRNSDALRRRNRDLSIIARILRVTSGERDLNVVLDQAIRGALDLTGLDGGIVSLADSASGALKFAASVNLPQELLSRFTERPNPGEGSLSGSAAKSGEPLIVWDDGGEQYATDDAVRRSGIRFRAAFPLAAGGKSVGVLSVFALGDRRPSQAALEVVRDLCGPIGLAIDNVRLLEETRRQARDLEIRVAERTAELSDLYNSAPCGYGMIDAEGRLVRINDTALRWLGYSSEEVLGRSAHEVLMRAGPEEFARTLQALKEARTLTDLERTFFRKDGTLLNALVNATAIFDSQGAVTGVRASFIDYTERKRAESEIQALNRILREQSDRLESINKELETFTYSVSHDLKAPLRGIDGYSRLLLEECCNNLTGEGRHFAESIRSATNQMTQLIDDLLAYSRMERRPLTMATQDVRALVELVCAQFAQEATERNVRLSLTLAPFSARLDREAMTIAVRNLVANALKFTRDVPHPSVEIGGRAGANVYTLSVRDNGPGFDMKYSERIFEIFQRLHRAEDYPGTGIGLALVRKAVGRMGGRAWAESAPGRGATFYLELAR